MWTPTGRPLLSGQRGGTPSNTFPFTKLWFTPISRGRPAIIGTDDNGFYLSEDRSVEGHSSLSVSLFLSLSFPLFTHRLTGIKSLLGVHIWFPFLCTSILFCVSVFLLLFSFFLILYVLSFYVSSERSVNSYIELSTWTVLRHMHILHYLQFIATCIA